VRLALQRLVTHGVVETQAAGRAELWQGAAARACRQEQGQYSLTSISGADRDTALRQARKLIEIAEKLISS
jgi:hypothetical protein